MFTRLAKEGLAVNVVVASVDEARAVWDRVMAPA